MTEIAYQSICNHHGAPGRRLGAHMIPDLDSRRRREGSSIHHTLNGFVRNTIRCFAVLRCANKQVLSAGHGNTVSRHVTSKIPSNGGAGACMHAPAICD